MPRNFECVGVQTYILSKSYLVPIFIPIFGAFFIPNKCY